MTEHINYSDNEGFVHKQIDRDALQQRNKGYLIIKRIQDIFFSLLAMIVLLPLFIVVALLIYLDDPHASALFRQYRCGKDGKQFVMYKFRTMYAGSEARLAELMPFNEKDGPVFKIKNDPRITRFGKFIRKTSIDELPQLLNILKGDMSIVGPRPPLPNEVEQYTPDQFQRLYVQQGLTSYWQIADNRYEMPFDEWVELDLKYIEEQSFLTDWKIIFKTFIQVFGAKGE